MFVPRLSAAIAGLVVATAAQASYVVTPLGTLGGTTSFALDINESGQVTGNAQTPVGTPNPRLNTFLFSGGPLANLGTLPGSNNFSRGYAINDAGVVVGESDNNSSRAFRWENGALTAYAGLAGPGAVAHGVNNAGVAVGASSNGTAVRAVRWPAGGTTPSDLGSLDGLTTTQARAWDINNSGVAVGHSRDAGGVARATRWNADGTLTDLGGLTATGFTEAFAIGDTGLVVGRSATGTTGSGTTIFRPFLWANGTMTELGTLGRTFGQANDVNAAGQAVGHVTNISGLAQRAVLWQDGVAIDLNGRIAANSGWVLTSAEGINDRGQIVGFGTFNGSTQAFLLTPTPVPPTLVGAVVGGLAAAGAVARRRVRN